MKAKAEEYDLAYWEISGLKGTGVNEFINQLLQKYGEIYLNWTT